MQEYIEQRVLEIGNYIIESGSTVRQTALEFGVSKSTVH
ncbi:MAG: sporulation transcriptional regulator SpoIIID, partial [Clostridiales bacterium]